MKKIMGLLLGGLLAFNAQAEQLLCGYRDYFHLSNSTPADIFIGAGSSNVDIALQIISPRSFELRDTPSCTAGYAHITIMADAFNWCVLDIKDGPFMKHPTINSSCNGLIFKGVSYDGFNSYSYSINVM